MPLPEGYDYSDEIVTWREWFRQSDPFFKGTLTGLASGIGLGSGCYFITKNMRTTSHVGWITYIAVTASSCSVGQAMVTAIVYQSISVKPELYFDKHNTRRTVFED